MKIGLLIKLIFSGFSLHWIPKQDWDFVFFFFFLFGAFELSYTEYGFSI